MTSEIVPHISKKIFSRKYISLGKVVTYWDRIVGEDMAGRAQPVRIHYRKARGGKSATATLEIAASSADAAILQYQTGIILEKIGILFGEQWITSLRFVHMPANRTKTVTKPKKPLTEQQKQQLSLVLDGTEDEEMKNRLSSLGAHIYQNM